VAGWVELAGGNSDAGDGVLEGYRGAGAVAGGGHLAEVAGEHGVSGQAVAGGVVGLVLPRALVAAEEEELVGDDLSTQGSAELVALDGVLCRGEEVCGVDDIVADEVEDGSVPLVGSGVGDDVDKRAGVNAATRRQRVRFDGELVQRVGEGIGQVDVGEV